MMAANFPFELSKPLMVSGDLGLRLTPLNAATHARLQLPEDASGVEVASVPPGSAADRAQLRIGDVILLQGNAVATPPDDAQKPLQETQMHGRAGSRLLIVNSSGQRWVALPTNAVQTR